jgi:Protein of unknown function (DUF1360)
MSSVDSSEETQIDEERPLPEYAGLAVTFWLVFAGFLATSRDRLPDRIPVGDFARITLSTYKLSRLITKDEVSAFLRAPVTEDDAGRRPKAEGFSRAMGELVTCPYCIGLWIASGLSYAQVVFPRETRFATSIFSAHAVTDFLHAGFVRLRKP